MKIIKKIARIFKEHEFQLTLYKISYDVMFCLIISIVLCLMLEAIIPGMVSGNNGFMIVSLLIFADILLVSYLGKKLGIYFKMSGRHHILPFAIFVAFILIGNSLLKFSLWQNLVATTLTIAVIVLFYQMALLDKK